MMLYINSFDESKWMDNRELENLNNKSIHIS